MADDDMLSERAFSGEWWLEGASEKKVAGNFAWSGRRAELTLAESFTPVVEGPHYGDTFVQYDAVHGVSSESKLVTLLKVSQSKFSMNFGLGGSKRPETVSSSLVFVGAHAREDTVIEQMRVRVPGLELWLGQTGILKVLAGDLNMGPDAMLCHVNPVPDIVMSLMDEALELRWITTATTPFTSPHRFSVREVGYLNLKPASSQTIWWYFEQLEKIFSILSLLAGTPMSYDQIKARLPEWPHIVDVLVARNGVSLCTYERSGDFFMTRAQLGDGFEAVIRQWFVIHGTIEEPVDLTLSILGSTALWTHVEFLSLMQALEGYHRSTTGDVGKLMTDAEFKPIKEALYASLPDALSPDQIHNLKVSIKLANQMSLAQRLSDLVARLEPQVAAYVLGEDATVPRAWVNTRDFYSHGEPALKPKSLSPQEMYEASARMKAFLRVLMLGQAGVGGEAICRSLTNTSDESQYLIQLNSREYRARHPGSTAGAVMFISTAAVAEALPVDPAEPGNKPATGDSTEPVSQ